MTTADRRRKEVIYAMFEHGSCKAESACCCSYRKLISPLLHTPCVQDARNVIKLTLNTKDTLCPSKCNEVCLLHILSSIAYNKTTILTCVIPKSPFCLRDRRVPYAENVRNSLFVLESSQGHTHTSSVTIQS